jgi:hypothetical protein
MRKCHGVNADWVSPLCERCGFLMEEERRYRALCMKVNRAGHGISGVTCGTDGYDEKKDSVIRRMRRKDFDYNRRKAHIVKYGTAFKLLDDVLKLIRDGVGDKHSLVKAIENTQKRYADAMNWNGTV